MTRRRYERLLMSIGVSARQARQYSRIKMQTRKTSYDAMFYLSDSIMTGFLMGMFGYPKEIVHTTDRAKANVDYAARMMEAKESRR